ncbi:hypothetical protein THF1C08_320039 [Vibrio jasicida]|uniref:Uncharacterized protein n=1 Tax=Vibrio jasicida TaxID=766224 RepID=A0AAU9QQ27_9VIBR|nr:hypothetical protein THF1C08_320039 [Vibrio jasicida]CAH1597397.1 hypothetical protein THF1A12_320039 [Vibrio jasicida]
MYSVVAPHPKKKFKLDWLGILNKIAGYTPLIAVQITVSSEERVNVISNRH